MRSHEILGNDFGCARRLAELIDEIKALYQTAWDKDILPGCIVSWKEMARRHIPDDGSESMMMDRRGTSCFVIKFGVPTELIVRALWDEHGKIAFASSANPSEKDDSGRVDGIGERINNAADDYVNQKRMRRLATNKESRRRWAAGRRPLRRIGGRIAHADCLASGDGGAITTTNLRFWPSTAKL